MDKRHFVLHNTEKEVLIELLNNYFSNGEAKKGENLNKIGTLYNLKRRLEMLKD